MRLGLIARSCHSGLGVQTRAVFDNMVPTRTLVVSMGHLARLAEHPHDFPVDPEHVRHTVFDGRRLPDVDLAWLLQDIDVLFTAETPYDWRLFDLARRHGVRTVLHLNPELDHHHRHADAPRPDQVALPTPWLHARHPFAVVLPMPVEPFTVEPGEWALHPAGWPASHDRNGTRLVLEASRWAERIKVRTQTAPDKPWHGATVKVGDVPDRESLYARAQLVVLPRRYGGLSLPLQEAMAAGLPVLATDCPPYACDLPSEALLPVDGRLSLQTKGGSVVMYSTAPKEIAAAVEAVQGDEGLRARLAKHSTAWAEAHTWAALRPTWDRVLAG